MRSRERGLQVRLVISIVVVAMVAATLITVAFGSDEPPFPGAVVDMMRSGEETVVPTRTAAATRTPPPTRTPAATGTSTSAVDGSETQVAVRTPTAPPASVPQRVSGFIYPVAGACLPERDDLMPGAPREYRQGVHEGLDFYDSDNCGFIGRGSEVLAAGAGTVVRAGWAYQDLTAASLAELSERVELGEGDAAAVQDAFRGRQVWIDHGEGIVTRYAHLSGIAAGVNIGAQVQQGAIVGYVGDSGTPESVTAPGTQIHLHFEIRVGDAYLGEGLDRGEIRRLYRQAFSP